MNGGIKKEVKNSVPGLDNARLKLVVSFIMGLCEIRSITGIWNRPQPDYYRACCDEEELEIG